MIREVAVLADQLGFDSLWVQEDLLGTPETLDVLTTLAFIALETERVDLGATVLLAPVWDPLRLAKTTATLDQLSSGRLSLGLGVDGADELILSFVFDESLAVDAAAHDIVPALSEQLGRQVA